MVFFCLSLGQVLGRFCSLGTERDLLGLKKYPSPEHKCCVDVNLKKQVFLGHRQLFIYFFINMIYKDKLSFKRCLKVVIVIFSEDCGNV